MIKVYICLECLAALVLAAVLRCCIVHVLTSTRSGILLSSGLQKIKAGASLPHKTSQCPCSSLDPKCLSRGHVRKGSISA